MLSVCIGHKSRAYVVVDGERRPLFKAALESLERAIRDLGLEAEVVIADWPDHSRPDLELGAWAHAAAPAPTRILPGEGPFTIGGAKNQAARASRGEVLFFMDADMLVDAATIRRGLEVVSGGRAFFPLYVRLSRDGSASAPGIGTGNAFCSRTAFELSGGFAERPGWGGDDTAFWHWFKVRALEIGRAHV